MEYNVEFLAGVLCFLQIADLAYKFHDRIQSNKESAGNIVIDIGNLIEEVAKDIEQGQYPHNKCSQLYTYLQNFETALVDVVTAEELAYFKTLIEEAYKVEQLFNDLQRVNESVRDRNINALHLVAGNFVTLGKLIKA